MQFSSPVLDIFFLVIFLRVDGFSQKSWFQLLLRTSNMRQNSAMSWNDCELHFGSFLPGLRTSSVVLLLLASSYLHRKALALHTRRARPLCRGAGARIPSRKQTLAHGIALTEEPPGRPLPCWPFNFRSQSVHATSSSDYRLLRRRRVVRHRLAESCSRLWGYREVGPLLLLRPLLGPPGTKSGSTAQVMRGLSTASLWVRGVGRPGLRISLDKSVVRTHSCRRVS